MQRATNLIRRSLFHRCFNLSRESRKWAGETELGISGCHCYATRASNFKSRNSSIGGLVHDQAQGWKKSEQDSQDVDHQNNDAPTRRIIGQNISAAEKRKYLLNTLLDLEDSKEAVYGTLDAWVAWEQNFPLASLKRALLVLEKEEQWHRIIQVLKWMLSKGQGTTMGTYEQLIRALEKDNRAEEAHEIWVKKVGHDLHSVPWRVCDLMLSIYHRNNMLERLVKLFQELEAYNRKPPSKSIVRKVVDAYEALGSLGEKYRLLEQYNHLFNESRKENSRKSKRLAHKNSTGKTSRTGWRNSEPSNSKAVDSGSSHVEICEAV